MGDRDEVVAVMMLGCWVRDGWVGIVSRWVRIVRIEHHVRRYMSSPRYCSSGCFPHLFLRCSASLLLSPCPSGVQALLPPLLPPPRRGDGPTCPATARRSIWAILPVRVFRPLLPPPHRGDVPTCPATVGRSISALLPVWVFRPLLPPPHRGDGPTCPVTARTSMRAILPVRVFRPLLPPPHRCDGPTSPATARRTMIRHRQRSRVFRPL